MSRFERDAVEPLSPSRLPDLWRDQYDFPLLSDHIDSATELCGQAPGGAAGERVAVVGTRETNTMVANLPAADWQQVLAYNLSRQLAQPPSPDLNREQRAEAYLSGVNDVLRSRGVEARFEAGTPPRLVIRRQGSDAMTVTELTDSVRLLGNSAAELAGILRIQLSGVAPGSTNETLRTAIVDAINGRLPSGLSNDDRAARIRSMAPIINQALHAQGLHIELGNDCTVNFHVWARTPPPGSRGAAIFDAAISLHAPANPVVERRDGAVEDMLGQIPRNAQAVRDMDPAARQALANLLMTGMLNHGAQLINRLNERIADRGIELVVLDPEQNAGRYELLIYARTASGRADSTLIPGIMMSPDADVAMRHRPARAGLETGRAIAGLLERFVSRHEAPSTVLRNTVMDVFWRQMADVEGDMTGQELIDRRRLFASHVQIALRRHGLDIEYDPNNPDTITLYRGVGAARRESISLDRPDYVRPRRDNEAVVNQDQPLVTDANREFWNGVITTLAVLGGVIGGPRAYRWIRGTAPAAAAAPVGELRVELPPLRDTARAARGGSAPSEAAIRVGDATIYVEHNGMRVPLNVEQRLALAREMIEEGRRRIQGEIEEIRRNTSLTEEERTRRIAERQRVMDEVANTRPEQVRFNIDPATRRISWARIGGYTLAAAVVAVVIAGWLRSRGPSGNPTTFGR